MTQTKIALIGLSYRTAPIQIREQFSCSVADIPTTHLALDCRFDNVREMVLVSTCNRVELYAALDDEPHVNQVMAALLAEITGVDTAVYTPNIYQHTGADAATHLFGVTAGLNSLVLGEPQIQGQVSRAYSKATAAKIIGPVLDELFRTAIRVGKRARSETGISHNPMSTSSMAIAQAQRILGDLRDKQHLIVGLGEMGKLAIKHLHNRKATNIALANRTRARAEFLADHINATIANMDDLATAIAQADVVVSATGAAHTVITTDMVAAAMEKRGPRPLVLLDIAVPRDIDPAIQHIPGVHLFDADQLKGNLDEALAARQQEVPKVEKIISTEVTALSAQLRQLSVKPVIVTLRERAEDIRQQELDRTLRHLGELDPQTLKHINHLSRSLVNKLLHEPTRRLKAKASDDDAASYAAAISDLFGLVE
ncbi:MAG: glutamyl-tRNA reductase [Chloroflexi bacterium]|nr:MAG: glutamyl-tRNA reductase [Chloroflexota bacterium]